MPAVQVESSFFQDFSNAPIRRILEAALLAADPQQAVRRLILPGGFLQVGGYTYNLSAYRRIFLVGFGKAAVKMAIPLLDRFNDLLSGGLLIVKESYAAVSTLLSNVQVVQAAHPIPDERGLAGANQLAELVSQAGPDDLVICLVSGGGSALLINPVSGVTLSDIQSLTGLLLASGASIQEINVLRKHLDRLKGGNLARLAFPASLLTLVLSDVVGDPLDIIASGPTVPDPSTFQDAHDILIRFRLEHRVPDSILKHIQAGLSGEIPETPKPGDPLFECSYTFLVGNNHQAALAAVEQARQLGFRVRLVSTTMQGEASTCGQRLAEFCQQIRQHWSKIFTSRPRKPLCLVLGGETTVTFTSAGLGGRNQELALAAIGGLAEMDYPPPLEIVLAALATDGGDGSTSSAGAIVTNRSLAQASSMGLEPGKFLASHNSYRFFEQLGGLLVTGPTQTNVNDLVFLFFFPV